MARNKKVTKPLMSVKHHFVDSLDEFLMKVLMLRQSLDQAIRLDLVKEPAKEMLQKALDELAAATDSDEQ